MTKRFFVILIASLVVTSMTACGNNAAATSTSAPETTEQYVESQGEGPVQGGIKSDEEIAALQAEEAEYASEETTDTTEYVDNAGHEPNSYISAENFWQGEDYFDLENYLYMNGASTVTKGYYDSNWSFQESDSNITVYKAYFQNPYWYVIISLPVSIEFRYDGYLLDGVPVLHPVYLVSQSTPVENQREVTVNDNGSTMTDTAIQTLDKMIELTKEHPDDDNPFQYNDRADLFGVEASSNEIPAGATKR